MMKRRSLIKTILGALSLVAFKKSFALDKFFRNNATKDAFAGQKFGTEIL
jgi:hypothetical protein